MSFILLQLLIPEGFETQFHAYVYLQLNISVCSMQEQ